MDDEPLRIIQIVYKCPYCGLARFEKEKEVVVEHMKVCGQNPNFPEQDCFNCIRRKSFTSIEPHGHDRGYRPMIERTYATCDCKWKRTEGAYCYGFIPKDKKDGVADE